MLTPRDTAVVLGLGAAAALLLSWPLPLHLDTHVLHPSMDPDVQCGLWWPSAFVDSVLAGQDPFFRPELGWPEGQDVRLLIWNFWLQLLLFPVYALLEPVAAMNVTALLAVVANGAACALAGWWATGKRESALAGLAVGALTIFGLFEAAAGRPEQGWWAPMAVYLGALLRLRRLPGDRLALAVAAVSLAIAGATYWFYAIFLGVATVAWLGWRVATRDLDRRGLLDLVKVAAGSIVLVLPFLVPLVSALSQQDSDYSVLRDTMDTVAQQARAALAFPHALAGRASGGVRNPATALPVWTIPLLLAGLAFRDSRGLSLVGLLGVTLCFGPHLVDSMGVPFMDLHIPLPHAALNALPGFSRFWWPYRWIPLVLTFAAPVAGLLIARFKHPTVPLLLFASVAMLDSKLLLQNSGLGVHQVEVPRVLAALADEPGTQPVIAWPMPIAENGLVGLVPFHKQPIDSGLAWTETSDLRSAAWQHRLETVPLFIGLNDIQNKGSTRQLIRGPEDTAGFRWVVVFLPEEEQVDNLTRWLGPAAERSPSFTVWAVPE